MYCFLHCWHCKQSTERNVLKEQSQDRLKIMHYTNQFFSLTNLVFSIDMRCTSPSGPPLLLLVRPPFRSSAASSSILTESSKRSWASDGGREDRAEWDLLLAISAEADVVER